MTRTSLRQMVASALVLGALAPLVVICVRRFLAGDTAPGVVAAAVGVVVAVGAGAVWRDVRDWTGWVDTLVTLAGGEVLATADDEGTGR